MKLKESVKKCKKTQQRKRERGLIELDRLLYRRMITFLDNLRQTQKYLEESTRRLV